MCISETLANQPPRHFLHLFNCIKRTLVVATGKLVDVPTQMLVTHFMVGADIAPFQHRPESLNSVGVGHTVDVFTNAMLHNLSVWDIVVT